MTGATGPSCARSCSTARTRERSPTSTANCSATPTARGRAAIAGRPDPLGGDWLVLRPEASDPSSGRGIAFQQSDDYVPPVWSAGGEPTAPGRQRQMVHLDMTVLDVDSLTRNEIGPLNSVRRSCSTAPTTTRSRSTSSPTLTVTRSASSSPEADRWWPPPSRPTSSGRCWERCSRCYVRQQEAGSPGPRRDADSPTLPSVLGSEHDRTRRCAGVVGGQAQQRVQERRGRLGRQLTWIDPLGANDADVTSARLLHLHRDGPEEHDQTPLTTLRPLVHAGGHEVLDVDGDPRFFTGLPCSGLLERLPVIQVPAGHLPDLGAQALVQHGEQPTFVNGPCERGCPGLPSHARQRS